MNLIQVVPDNEYMVWQLYIQMQNFRDYSIEQNAQILVAISIGKTPSKAMLAFEKWTKAKVFYYQDTRKQTDYLSTIRPHLLAKHFHKYPTNESFFYHDQDIIFLRKPQIDTLNDGFCYVAPMSNSYLNSIYLKKFKPYIFPSMAAIVGISTELVEQNDANAGGAQYVLKGVSGTWWEKVERDCDGLYRYMRDITTTGLRKYNADEELPSYHVTIWCADMWAIFWNLLLSGIPVRTHPEVDFSWPTCMLSDNKAILHNAGIDENNEFKRTYEVYNSDGSLNTVADHIWAMKRKEEIGGSTKLISSVPEYFNKTNYTGTEMPFGKRFDFVDKARAQYKYVEYIHSININQPTMQERKITGVFCTTNNINPVLLATVLSNIKKAADSCTAAVVEIVTCSWEPIPNNPFKGVTTPFRNLGHLNYVLQIKQALLASNPSDIVCVLEHDVLYPEDYFTTVITNWDYNKYGLCNDNYIGMNETGYLEVKARHKPFSMMSFARFYLEAHLDKCVNQVVATIGTETWAPQGYCLMEPDNKNELAHLPFTNTRPAIHVNMNHLGAWGTGAQGKNHHFTTHCEACYEDQSNGVTTREDWGDYKQYFNFN